MQEGQLLESLIVLGAVVTVLGAIGSILYRITYGDGASRRLDKLKESLEQEKAASSASAPASAPASASAKKNG